MHRLSRGLVPLVLMFAVVLISGCSLDVASGDTLPAPAATATPAPTPIPLAENLTFKGDIAGTLTAGIAPRPLTHDDPMPALATATDGSFVEPPPRFTQCSTFDAIGGGTLDDYLAVIVGNVGAKRYAVVVEINMDQPAYTKPGTQLLPGDTNTGGSVNVYEVGGKNEVWQQVFGPNLQEAAVIVLNANRKSGTVNAWMASADLSQKDAPATLHIQGDWRCG